MAARRNPESFGYPPVPLPLPAIVRDRKRRGLACAIGNQILGVGLRPDVAGYHARLTLFLGPFLVSRSIQNQNSLPAGNDVGLARQDFRSYIMGLRAPRRSRCHRRVCRPCRGQDPALSSAARGIEYGCPLLRPLLWVHLAADCQSRSPGPRRAGLSTVDFPSCPPGREGIAAPLSPVPVAASFSERANFFRKRFTRVTVMSSRRAARWRFPSHSETLCSIAENSIWESGVPSGTSIRILALPFIAL